MFASLYEGFGLPILEAQSVGRLVITSNRGAMAEVAGKGALLVDPDSVKAIHNGVISAIHNLPLRTSLLSEGIINKDKYNMQTIMQQHESVYSNF